MQKHTLQPTTILPSPSSSGPAYGASISAPPASATGRLTTQRHAAVPALRSPIHSSDSPATTQHKLDIMISRSRGTTAPVRASGKRKRDEVAGDANGHSNALGKLSGNQGPNDGAQLAALPATSSAAERCTAPPSAPLPTGFSFASGSSTAPPKVLGQDHGRHKRAGFMKRSGGESTMKAGNSQRSTRTSMLDQRDKQVDTTFTGPRSPTHGPRNSMFPSNA
jgi:hypothetical protein